MLQPEVLASHICELGNTNLTHTKAIIKKKNSYQQITTHNKIPRSLRTKCELTTSPSYSSNPKFLQIKESLQNATNDYIKTGIKFMTEWAEENILLLLQDHCHAILKKALQLLDGIALYNAAVIFIPNWFSSSQNQNKLLLFKLYLSNQLIDTRELIEYLEVPLNIIRLTGAKILTDNGSNKTALNSINSANLQSINLNPTDEFNFLSETLINFDQILRIMTINLWEVQREKSKQISAAITLKSRMDAFKVLDVTASTASAITRATEAYSKSQASSLQTSLRLSNLEKAACIQTQKTNEFSKALHSLPNQKKRSISNQEKQIFVDLTEDEEDSINSANTQQQRQRPNMREKRHEQQPPPQKMQKKEANKTVHWNELEPTELASQHPQAKNKSQFNATPQIIPLPRQTTMSFFQPAPPPIPPPAPSPTSMFNAQQKSPFNIWQESSTTKNPSQTINAQLKSPFINWQRMSLIETTSQGTTSTQNPFQIATHTQRKTNPNNLTNSNRGRNISRKRQRKR